MHLDAVDMGKDRVVKVIVLMALPAMFSMFFQNLYEFVDTMFISWLGADPLGAMGLVMPIFYGALALSKSVQYGLIGISAGARGRGDTEQAETTLAAGLPLMLLLMLPFLLLTIPDIGKSLFGLMGASGILVEQSYTYAFWLVLSFPVMAYFMIGEAMLVGRGDTKSPMMAMVGGNLINLILDPILMFGLGWGLAGAAIATLIGWTLSVVFLLYRLNKLGLHMPGLGWKAAYVRIWNQISRISVYGFIAQISSPLGLALVNLVLVGFGANAVGAWTIMSRLELFSLLPLFGVASALIAFISYNAARGSYARIRRGLWVALGVSIVFVMPIAGVFIMAPHQVIVPFRADPQTASMAAYAIQMAAYAHVICPVELVLFGLAQGLKKPYFYLPAVITRLFLLRYPLALFMAAHYGAQGVFLSQPLSNVGTAILSATLIMVLIRQMPNPEITLQAA